jgi:hypothetical protein
MNNSTLRDSIFTDLDEYDQIVFFFESIIKDLNQGFDYDSIGIKYSDAWYVILAGAFVPWDNTFLQSFYEELKKFETLDTNKNITNYFWNKFEEIQNTIWSQSPKIAKIANQNGWYNGDQIKIFRDSTYDPKSPYFGSFPIPEQYLPKIKSTELVEV